MKKNICLLILCIVTVEVHPMLSRWLQRGRNTNSMQRSKPALSKVTLYERMVLAANGAGGMKLNIKLIELGQIS